MPRESTPKPNRKPKPPRVRNFRLWYYSLYGVPQAVARWEIGQSESFATVLHVATMVGAGVSYTVPTGVLTVSSIYFWRVSYKDADGNWSLPSDATGFTTGSIFQYISQPAITAPVNNTTGVSTTPTLTYSAFAVVGGSDAHDATQVQLAMAGQFISVVRAP